MESLITLYTDIFSSMDTMTKVLFIFWSICVVLFFSSFFMIIVMTIKQGVTNLFKKRPRPQTFQCCFIVCQKLNPHHFMVGVFYWYFGNIGNITALIQWNIVRHNLLRTFRRCDQFIKLFGTCPSNFPRRHGACRF